MDISVLAALADVLTTLFVLVSLGFVYVEMRRSNRENRLANWLTTTQRLYDFRNRSSDPYLADLVLRGRESFANLSGPEAEAFRKYLLSAQLVAQSFPRLNGLGVEDTKTGWHAARTIIRQEWDFPGPRAWWEEIRHDPPIVPRAAAWLDEALDYPPMERNMA